MQSGYMYLYGVLGVLRTGFRDWSASRRRVFVESKADEVKCVVKDHCSANYYPYCDHYDITNKERWMGQFLSRWPVSRGFIHIRDGGRFFVNALAKNDEVGYSVTTYPRFTMARFLKGGFPFVFSTSTSQTEDAPGKSQIFCENAIASFWFEETGNNPKDCMRLDCSYL